uniref:Nitrogen response factor NRF1 n=1 Tax=Ganoderma boninense TaxID=34458 RepID=A0A5K1JRV3_9APHY|nr:Nitrogen response factor NRF1 [Ganoderma boninense]
MFDAASFSRSPRVMPQTHPVLFSTQNRHHVPTAAVSSPPQCWPSHTSTQVFRGLGFRFIEFFSILRTVNYFYGLHALFCYRLLFRFLRSFRFFKSRSWRSESASSANAFSRKLKEVYRTVSEIESKLLGNDRDRERGDGDRAAPRGLLSKSVPPAQALRETPRARRMSRTGGASLFLHTSNFRRAWLWPFQCRWQSSTLQSIVRDSYHPNPSPRPNPKPSPSPSSHALRGLTLELDVRRDVLPPVHRLAHFARLSAYASLLSTSHSGHSLLAGRPSPLTTLMRSSIVRGGSPRSRPATAAKHAIPGVARVLVRGDEPRAKIRTRTPNGRSSVVYVSPIAAKRREGEGELVVVCGDVEGTHLCVRKDWLARDLAITPNSGKGLLGHDKDGTDEELRGVYHAVKRMVAFRPFSTACESMLTWSSATHDAGLAVLNALMLLTNIQLDDFKPASQMGSSW